MAYNQYNHGGRPPQGGRQSQSQYAPQPQYGGRAQPQGYGGAAQKSGTSSVFWIILCVVVVVMLGVGLLVGFFLGKAIGGSNGPGAHLAVPNISLSGDTLSWDEIPNATGYKIQKDGKPSDAIQGATDTSYDLKKLNLGEGTYRFAVASKGNGGSIKDSLFSKEITYEKRDEGTAENQLTKPTNLSVSDNKVLQWNAVNNAGTYNIQISGQADKTSTTNSLDISYLPAEQDFVIKIQAAANGQYLASNWSDPYNYTTKQGSLSAPVITLSTTQVSWNAVPNATGYVVSIDGSEKTTTATNYDLSNLADGKTYQIKVKATKGSVESSWSNSLSFTPEPPKVFVKVTFDANGGTGLSQTSKDVVLGGFYGSLPAITAPSGQSLVGWFDSKTGGNKVTSATTVTNQNAHTLYARFGAKDPSATGPDAVQERFEKYIDQNIYENDLFPNRFGTRNWKDDVAEIHTFYPDEADRESRTDFYSWDNFISALRALAELKATYEWVGNQQYLVQVENTTTGKITKIDNPSRAFAKGKVVRETVEYGDFLNSSDENDNKRELSGFFANMSHESGAYGYINGEDPPEWLGPGFNKYQWGFAFNEETTHIGHTESEYSDHGSAEYPPVPGHSYHGRGPIQLTWNYNYGFFSQLIFGDKNVLLKNPELVCQDGEIGIMSAIWFWMTPQAPKASCHDIMLNKYVFNPNDPWEKNYENCFGLTMVVINGHFESNKTPEEWPQVKNRIAFYKKYTSRLGANIDGEKLDTKGFYEWGV
ncbi:MAG: InlB B-repeat-containing protein [Firmicutes bacterium]|nr:InlB B-repeat-containing protein [Bacillota bacterium]